MNRNILLVLFLLGIVLTVSTIVDAKSDTNSPNKDIKTNLTTPMKPYSISSKELVNAIDVTKEIEKSNSIMSTSADATNIFVTVRGLEYTKIKDPNGECRNQRIYSSWLTGDIWYWDCWYFEKGVIYENKLNDFFMLPITVEVWKNDASLSPLQGFRTNTKIWSCGGSGCYTLLDNTKFTDSNGIAKIGFKISRNKYLNYGKYYYVNVDVWDNDYSQYPSGYKYNYYKEFYLEW